MRQGGSICREGERPASDLVAVFGRAETRFGPAILLGEDDLLAALIFLPEGAMAEAEFLPGWAKCYERLIRDDERASDWARRSFSGSPPGLSIYGTLFQRKVWHALMDIPPGKTCSYAELARAVSSHKAARAVGGACGANNIAWLIPCHRVIGANGSLTGYGGGLERKCQMLEFEREAQAFFSKGLRPSNSAA